MTHKSKMYLLHSLMYLLLFLSIVAESLAVSGYFSGGLFIDITQTMSMILEALGLLGFATAWIIRTEIKNLVGSNKP
ncbi:hypothetical protein ACYVOU_002308 [Vibrio cholerae]